MLQTIRHFLSLIRFSHTLFALPFALLAALMAWRMQALELPAETIGPYGRMTYSSGALAEEASVDVMVHDSYLNVLGAKIPTSFDFVGPEKFRVRWQELIGILLCMVFARSAAMAFNRLVDRKLDALNPRTAGRHIPAGLLSAGQVTFFAVACSAGFVASTLLFLPNRLPLYLAVPLLAFLCGYSYAKRFTSLAHFWLGVALAMSPIAAWIAIRGETVARHPADLLPAIVLGAAVAAWVAGFDIIYACQDFAYDREAKLHSIPVRLGVAGALRLAAGCHFVTIALLAILPLIYPPFGGLWWAGVAAVAALLVYEHALVRPDDLARVNTAFFNVNAIISLGLLVVGTVDLLL
ncbi:MAG: 4-hydroxybenzoate octaprenyltransferase [Pirellula sp.]|nr:4-hydroxybenzoate octaprenyltransferase [Pirellula sp.]